MTACKHEDGSWVAGTGQYSHEVPVEPGRVVLMHDSHHEGTEVYLTESGQFRFVDLTSRTWETVNRVLLLRLEEDTAGELSGGWEAFAVDVDSPDGLALVGTNNSTASADELAEGWGEVLWDSDAGVRVALEMD